MASVEDGGGRDPLLLQQVVCCCSDHGNHCHGTIHSNPSLFPTLGVYSVPMPEQLRPNWGSDARPTELEHFIVPYIHSRLLSYLYAYLYVAYYRALSGSICTEISSDCSRPRRHRGISDSAFREHCHWVWSSLGLCFCRAGHP